MPAHADDEPQPFYLDASDIARIVRDLADRLREEYPLGVYVIVVMRGGMMLAVDLVRALHPHPVRLDVHPGTTMDLRHTRVLLVDDIIDSGATARKLIAWALDQGADDVAVCALLQRRGTPELPVRTFAGVTIDSDEFVKGYGMDDGSGDAGRELPYVAGTGRRSDRAPARERRGF